MNCTLCHDMLMIQSPTSGVPLRCPCQKDAEIPCVSLRAFDQSQSLDATLGVEPWCFVCDPRRERRLSRGVMIVRTAWLPNGQHAHHDRAARAQNKSPSRIVTCIECVSLFNGFVMTRGQPLFRTVSAAREQALGDTLSEQSCVQCGCTDAEPCVDDAGNACGWIEADRCSACPKSSIILTDSP